MKYVMIQRTLSSSMGDDNVTLYPIIFPRELVHADIAEAIQSMISKQWPDREVSVVSAGDIDVKCGRVSGFSETLMLQSDPEDNAAISLVDYFSIHHFRTPNKLEK